METWIVHHTNTTIHRCAANAPALPSHLEAIDFRNAEIFTRIQGRELRHLARAYSSYICCEECEAALLNPVKHRGAA
jgi:hypothetical protein